MVDLSDGFGLIVAEICVGLVSRKGFTSRILFVLDSSH